MDQRGAAWLAATVEEASRSPVLVDFNKSLSEGRKSLSVRRGCNKGGRFLEMVALVDDDRKGIIRIPEAQSGRGWWRFVSELRSLLAALASSPGSSSVGSILEERSSGSLQTVKAGRLYAEVLRSPSGEAVVSVGPKLLSSQEIDLLPMANRVELMVRAAWDCSKVQNGCSVPP